MRLIRFATLLAAALAVSAPVVHGEEVSRSLHVEEAIDGPRTVADDLFNALAGVESKLDGGAQPANFVIPHLDSPPTEEPRSDNAPAVSSGARGCGDAVDGDCGADGKCVCQAATAGKPNPCATSHNGVFYANDFSYLLDPDYHGHCLGDCWKLMPVGCCGQYGTLDIGGQLRMRYHHEVGMGQDVSGPGVNRFEDTVHDFVLTRLRL